MRPVADRFWEKVSVTDGCWEWQAYVHPSGYGMFGLDGRVQGSHRVSYILSHGPIPEGQNVLHHCDNRRCVRPDHLYLGGQSQNMKDCVERGRHVVHRGSSNGAARFSEEQVAEMRARYAAGESPTVIAADFGTSRDYVWKLGTYKWRKTG